MALVLKTTPEIVTVAVEGVDDAITFKKLVASKAARLDDWFADATKNGVTNEVWLRYQAMLVQATVVNADGSEYFTAEQIDTLIDQVWLGAVFAKSLEISKIKKDGEEEVVKKD